ncbi:hypothetical protein BVY04_02210 [bacterium M21]|nr:hypothetical protein BVY04_02210 [bacterium M21]
MKDKELACQIYLLVIVTSAAVSPAARVAILSIELYRHLADNFAVSWVQTEACEFVRIFYSVDQSWAIKGR